MKAINVLKYIIGTIALIAVAAIFGLSFREAEGTLRIVMIIGVAGMFAVYVLLAAESLFQAKAYKKPMVDIATNSDGEAVDLTDWKYKLTSDGYVLLDHNMAVPCMKAIIPTNINGIKVTAMSIDVLIKDEAVVEEIVAE